MILGGLWHGAAWTFIIWGSLHGLFLVINRFWRQVYEKYNFTFENNRLYILFSWSLTMFCIVFAWVFFRAKDFSCAKSVVMSMTGLNGLSVSSALTGVLPSFSWIKFDGFFNNSYFYLWDYAPLLAGAIAITLMFPNLNDFFSNHLRFDKEAMYMNSKHPYLSLSWAPNKFYAVLLAVMTLWILLALMAARKVEFLYFNF
jgi:hypothetical protein